MPSTKRCILASQRPIHALHSAAIVRAFSVVCQLQNLRSFSQERQAQITALERRVSELEMHLRDYWGEGPFLPWELSEPGEY